MYSTVQEMDQIYSCVCVFGNQIKQNLRAHKS